MSITENKLPDNELGKALDKGFTKIEACKYDFRPNTGRQCKITKFLRFIEQ